MPLLIGFLTTIFTLLGLFNTVSWIVSIVWLIIDGQWALLIYGAIISFMMPFVYSLCVIPQMVIVGPAVYYLEKKNITLGMVFAFLGAIYSDVILAFWALFVFSIVYSKAADVNILPLLLWGYATVLSPLSYMASKEPPENVGSFFGILTGLISYVALLIMWGMGNTDYVAGLSVVVVLMALAQSVLAYYETQGVSMAEKRKAEEIEKDARIEAEWQPQWEKLLSENPQYSVLEGEFWGLVRDNLRIEQIRETLKNRLPEHYHTCIGSLVEYLPDTTKGQEIKKRLEKIKSTNDKDEWAKILLEINELLRLPEVKEYIEKGIGSALITISIQDISKILGKECIMDYCQNCKEIQILKNGLCDICNKEQKRLEKLCKRCKREPKYKDGLCKKCSEEEEKRQKELQKKMDEVKDLSLSTGKNIKVLCIDDEPSVLESYKMILAITDIEVVTAPDGYAGLSMLTADFDMVFTGFKMPGMDGFEVLKKIKESFPYMPVAIIAAYYPKGIREQAIEKGAFEYLRKPFLMEEIYELVQEGIKLRNKQKKATSGE